MKPVLGVALSGLLLGGCAVNCGADWREVGTNEGRLGASPQVERYAASCSAFNREAYTEGWSAGNAARPRIPAM
jgi:hypothetical protein